MGEADGLPAVLEAVVVKIEVLVDVDVLSVGVVDGDRDRVCVPRQSLARMISPPPSRHEYIPLLSISHRTPPILFSHV